MQTRYQLRQGPMMIPPTASRTGSPDREGLAFVPRAHTGGGTMPPVAARSAVPGCEPGRCDTIGDDGSNRAAGWLPPQKLFPLLS
jgi:hypothetical protein